MVYLNRIYTGSGDEGETSLGDGTRVAKTDARVIAYGCVDEVNAALGVAAAHQLPEPLAGRIDVIQNDLFDVGADLCVPESEAADGNSSALRIVSDQPDRLEHWIDEATEQLQPLDSFILPGGSPAAAQLHLARTICRRSEIAVWTLAEREHVNAQVHRYLNRLSDLLFVWARLCNDNGRSDVKWKPAAGRAVD